MRLIIPHGKGQFAKLGAGKTGMVFILLSILITAISHSADILSHEFQVPEDTSSKKEIREQPAASWPSCQSHSAVNESQLQTLLWHRHMPGWLSSCTIRLVTHSMTAPPHSTRRTTEFWSLCWWCSCNSKDVSRDWETQTQTGDSGELDNWRRVKTNSKEVQKNAVLNSAYS